MKAGASQKLFNNKANAVAFDAEHRRKINFNMSRYDGAVKKGKTIYRDLDLARKRAGHIKYKVLNDLDKYLIEFEDHFVSNGGKIIWARHAEDALQGILEIVRKYDVKRVVKSKSMTTEEIDLNEKLADVKVKVLETDLGEFIVQQAGQKPYHIVTPAMHMSKEDVARLYHEKFSVREKMSPEELTAFTRKLLRSEFPKADLGITGANFLIADIGGIAITENEGNGLLSMSFPKIHIVIAGIEKIIPHFEDLDLFWPLLATSGTGQPMTVYNSVLTGPKKSAEKNGPEEMYLVLIDNGRSHLLSLERQRQALSCIRCGACLNACPVYRNIGGHTYNTTYSGPIGAVINPFLGDFAENKHQSFASSLCGKCTTVCPVNIPLHELLLVNRQYAVKNGYTSFVEKQGMKLSAWGMHSRRKMDMAGGKLKNKMAHSILTNTWGPRRDLPKFSEKSFNRIWKENQESD
ncbi:MAG: lactate utilization protein B [bacterium]|jgi:L-lactate dehydrogenase complex protein LldF